MSAIPEPAAHGGDGAAVARALGLPADAVLDLSVSLNPLAADPVPVLVRHAGSVRRYPDPAVATAALAAAIGVPTDRLLLTNGGAEAIALVAAELGGSVVEPEFSLYPRAGGPRWRSNPHNPSGRLAAADERAGVWDEAFYPLATGRWTRGDPDTVVVGSLTKLLACPGLRLGYLIGDPGLVAACRRRQPAWSVSGPAAAALPDLLAEVALPRWAAGVAALRAELVSLLARYGLVARASDACWVLVPAPGLRERLARHRVVVRDCAGFGLPGTVRVAVPSAAGLDRLATALHRSVPVPAA